MARTYNPFGRAQYAPRAITIAVALVLILAGLLGTYGDVLPEAVGLWAFVAATVLLLLGIFFERI